MSGQTGHGWQINVAQKKKVRAGNEGKNTDINSEYVILTAFPLQQCLPQKSSMLCDAYVAFLVYNVFHKSQIKYTFVKRTITSWNRLPASLLSSFPCKLNTFRKRVKNVVTSMGIEVGIECK